MLIPKIIHYCWFGPNEMPATSKRYIKGWHMKNPDFKIIKWSKNNFDINKYLFTYRAYKNHDWAAVSDYVRLKALKKYGGIYLDTDVEDIKPLKTLLVNKSFIGMENVGVINSGLIFGCHPNNKYVISLLKYYNSISTSKNFVELANNQVYITTMYFTKLGYKRKNVLQHVKDFTIYPTDYFCPQRRGYKSIYIDSNTLTFHHYDASWTNGSMTSRRRINIYIGDLFIKLFGIYAFKKIYGLYKFFKK